MVNEALPFTVPARPGTFEHYQVDLQGAPADPAFYRCVVGSDELSLSWLKQRQALLLKYGAVCYLANVQSLSEIDRVRKIAYPVQVLPVSAQALIEAYRIKHYPALIHAQWVYQ